MPANPDPQTAELVPVRYMSDRFEWAAPGDQQEDAWLVRFCDKDIREAIYTGPDAEQEAWAAWERHAPGYNMYVFRLARLAHAKEQAAGPIPMLCLKCKRTMELPRADAPDVPAWVAKIEHDACDQCDTGDRSAEHWIAADGSEPDPDTMLAPAPASSVGEGVEREASDLQDFASLMVDEVIAATKAQLERGEGLSVADQLHMLNQLIKERERLTRATPDRSPAPADLVELEAAVERISAAMMGMKPGSITLTEEAASFGIVSARTVVACGYDDLRVVLACVDKALAALRSPDDLAKGRGK